MRLGGVFGEDLGIELARCADATACATSAAAVGGMRTDRNLRNVAVDDLCEGNVAGVREEIEAFRLDASGLQRLPLEVIAGSLSVWLRLGLLGDRLDRGGAIDGLLGAGDVGQPGGRPVSQNRRLRGTRPRLTVALPS